MIYLDQIRTTIKALGSIPPIEIPKSIETNLLEAFRSWKQSR
jgi:hypothetical protein